MALGSCSSRHSCGCNGTFFTTVSWDVFQIQQSRKALLLQERETSCIINMALRPHFEHKLVLEMKRAPYELAINSSNDNRLQKNESGNSATVWYRNWSGVNTIFRHCAWHQVLAQPQLQQYLGQWTVFSSPEIFPGTFALDCLWTILP